MKENVLFKLGAKLKHRFGVVDTLVSVIVLVIVIFLGSMLVGQISLKHEVAGAKVIGNAFVHDLHTQDAARARALGDKSFQAGHSVAELQTLFKSAKPFTPGAPAIIDQTVTNDKNADNVRFIYKYGTAKPYYVRVIVSKTKQSGKWQLINIAGDPSEVNLLKTVITK